MDITLFLLEKYRQRPAIVGKFNCSGVYGILHGYTSVEEHLNGKPSMFHEALRMWQGVGKHRQIQELFEDRGYKIEERVEYKAPQYEWTLTGKADLMTDKQIIEIKTSQELLKVAKPWALYQLKLYLSLFNVPEGIIVQPIIKPDGIELKELGKIKKPTEEWFDKQMEALNNFHKELIEYARQNKKK